MKIAINCVFFQPKGGGVKEYMLNLLDNLEKIDHENEYVVYVLSDMLDFAKRNLPARFKLKTIPFKSGGNLEKIKRSLFEGKFWVKEEKRENWDLFHSPFFHAPKLRNTPVMLTVHDMRFFRFPETYAFLRYHFLKRKVKNSIKRADHIISISNFTKREIIEAYGVDKDKISVVHEAINTEKFQKRNDKPSSEIPEALIGNRFLLAAGHLEPRKNYLSLIKAFRNLKSESRFSDLQLVIVGKKDHSYAETLKAIEENNSIHYLDFVELDTLLWLYGNATLHVFPSIYEGFGFPPLEAGGMGTVSAVSNISSIPEVCGDAAFYFNPYDVEDIQRVIAEGLENRDKYLEIKDKLPHQLSKFSWRKNAAETLNLYRNITSR